MGAHAGVTLKKKQQQQWNKQYTVKSTINVLVKKGKKRSLVKKVLTYELSAIIL